jgi:hypothetical protein
VQPSPRHPAISDGQRVDVSGDDWNLTIMRPTYMHTYVRVEKETYCSKTTHRQTVVGHNWNSKVYTVSKDKMLELNLDFGRDCYWTVLDDIARSRTIVLRPRFLHPRRVFQCNQYLQSHRIWQWVPLPSHLW